MLKGFINVMKDSRRCISFLKTKPHASTGPIVNKITKFRMKKPSIELAFVEYQSPNISNARQKIKQFKPNLTISGIAVSLK